jgi:hypothetical protein
LVDRRRGRRSAVLSCVVLASTTALQAQTGIPLDRERSEFARWLATAPTSPFRALAHQRIGDGLTIGPAGSAIVLAGGPPSRVTMTGGRAALRSGNTDRALPRGVTTPLGVYRLLVNGMPSRATLTVFGETTPVLLPAWFPYSPAAVDTVTLTPAPPDRVTLLAPDGSDVEAFEAGTVTVRRFGAPVTLTVRRLPGASPDESELEIYFRDATNGFGSYPAGRFVTLVPLGGTRYLLDFNTARNPWCAYNTVFPCPPPWPGNAIAVRVAAGEMYRPEQAEQDR